MTMLVNNHLLQSLSLLHDDLEIVKHRVKAGGQGIRIKINKESIT